MGIDDRKQRDFQRREQEILAAALTLARREDWQAVTIDQIAEMAEIGKGTVYKHFKSKDEVCARIVTEHLQSLVHKLQAIDPATHYVPRMKEVLKTIWRHDLERADLLGLSRYCELSEDSLLLGEAAAQEFRKVRDAFRGFLHALVEEGIARGIVPAQPLHYLLAAGWSTSLGVIRLLGKGLEFPQLAQDPAFLDYLADYVVKGLLNAAPSPRA